MIASWLAAFGCVVVVLEGDARYDDGVKLFANEVEFFLFVPSRVDHDGLVFDV